MDFKQIEAFVNVVKHKSFSKAADAMFFTQPTISAHISSLETELNTKLLNRRGRSVELTKSGNQFYKYAVELMNIRENAFNSMAKSRGEVSGVLEIQASSIPGITFLPEMVAKFSKLYTNIKFYIDISDSDQVIENIQERQSDIGFVGEKSSNSSFNYEKILSDRVVVIASKDSEIGEEDITLKEISKHPLIWRESGSATRRSFEKAAMKKGVKKEDFDVVASVNELEVVVRLVEEGLGISILSEESIKSINPSGIKTINIKDFAEEREFYMIIPKDGTLSPIAKKFKEFIISEINESK